MTDQNKKLDQFELALVTGASTGIGRGMCQLLASKGIDLIVVARSQDKLEELKTELGTRVDVDIVVADLSDTDQRKKVLEKIYERTPDLIINNAGWGYYGEALTYETAETMNVLDLNVNALVEITLEGARAMVTKGKTGVIMNVSSSAAFQIFPNFAIYASSKAFVNLFSESLDVEMQDHGIRVLVCCPGFVATEFRHRASSGESTRSRSGSMTVEFAAEEIWKQIVKRIPIRAFDWKFRFATFLTTYLLPKKLVAYVVRKKVQELHSKRHFIPIE